MQLCKQADQQTDRQTNKLQGDTDFLLTAVVAFDVGIKLYSVISLKSSVIIYRPTTLSLTKLDNPLAGRTRPEQ